MSETYQRFLESFAVPEAAAAFMDRFVNPPEAALIAGMASGRFTACDAVPVLSAATDATWTEADAREFLDQAYRRGVLRLVGEGDANFEVGSFAERLEVMVISRPEEYLALDASLREALDAWCFEKYLSGLGPEERPTGDRVATLDEALSFIDDSMRQIYLNSCDCRVLAGLCDHPTRTCITFRDGPNTASHRGWSTPLSKAEAKEVVRRADADGLVHMVNDDGMCNCCSDCCYLLRAQEARRSGATWPLSRALASVDPDLCILCGECVERCPFEAFTLVDDELMRSADLCRGCGLCVETCPADAIAMEPREETRDLPRP